MQGGDATCPTPQNSRFIYSESHAVLLLFWSSFRTNQLDGLVESTLIFASRRLTEFQGSSLFFIQSRPLNFVSITETVYVTESSCVKSLINSISHDVAFNARFSSARRCTSDNKKASIPPLKIILSICSKGKELACPWISSINLPRTHYKTWIFSIFI